MVPGHGSSCLPEKGQYFRQLKQTPAISWPALALLALGLSILIASSAAALSGAIPLWVGTLINGVGLYLLFSPMHESLHRNVSSNNRLNELIGRISLMLLIPAAPLEVARWAHFQHHRFTSGDMDPDHFIHGAKWWQTPLRWGNFDIHYLHSFLRDGGEHRERHARALASSIVTMVVVFVALAYFGYGWEVLFLWILASRVGLFLVSLVFVFLPHYPANISSADNEYQATTMRMGWEWLLTPLFVYQNYHLIHHLYPTAPFYNYSKIWHLKYEELIAHNPAIQTGFGLMPVNHEQAHP